ncbi:hypothetical protein MHBO_001838 [Bonamia ostreae]|uniref:MORN repeat-containing protein n=1 Tax=Bonamia ostreae TaxID=126728 RepID=A0ABV2ALE1_9EUKA
MSELICEQKFEQILKQRLFELEKEILRQLADLKKWNKQRENRKSHKNEINEECYQREMICIFSKTKNDLNLLKKNLIDCRKDVKDIKSAIFENKKMGTFKKINKMIKDFKLFNSERGFGATNAVGTYNGQISEGLPDGEGEWTGIFFRFNGNWKKGVIDGIGVVTKLSNGEWFNGFWENGVLINKF